MYPVPVQNLTNFLYSTVLILAHAKVCSPPPVLLRSPPRSRVPKPHCFCGRGKMKVAVCILLAWAAGSSEGKPVEQIIEELRSGSARTQEQAASELRNLAVNADNQVAIAQAGGIAPLVELTRSGSAYAKEKAAGALWSLALNADNQVAIAQAGGIGPLVELTRSGSAYAKERAAGALRNLALNADNKVAIAQAGGIAPLVEHPRSSSAGANDWEIDIALWLIVFLIFRIVFWRTQKVEGSNVAPLLSARHARSDAAVAEDNDDPRCA